MAEAEFIVSDMASEDEKRIRQIFWWERFYCLPLLPSLARSMSPESAFYNWNSILKTDPQSAYMCHFAENQQHFEQFWKSTHLKVSREQRIEHTEDPWRCGFGYLKCISSVSKLCSCALIWDHSEWNATRLGKLFILKDFHCCQWVALVKRSVVFSIRGVTRPRLTLSRSLQEVQKEWYQIIALKWRFVLHRFKNSDNRLGATCVECVCSWSTLWKIRVWSSDFTKSRIHDVLHLFQEHF